MTPPTLADLARMFDHSLLQPHLTDDDLERGCLLAREYGVASVCIKPYAVKRAVELLRGSGVLVGAVIGFPHGNSCTESKRYETELACRDGAVEIDMVINIGKALSGDWDYVENDVRAVCEEAHRHGAKVKVIFENDYLGAGADTLTIVAGGRHAFAETLKKAERPLVILGPGAYARPDGAALAALAAKAAVELGAVKDGWNGYSVLHTAASRVGAFDIGFAPGMGGLRAGDMAKAGALDVLFLLGADEIDVQPGAFVVYIGTHGDDGAHRADVILPGAAYTEKSGIYVNTEGRVQMANRAAFPPGEAREDWAIIRALSDVISKKLPYDSLAGLRQALFKAYPHLMRIDQIEVGKASDVKALAGKGGSVDKAAFKPGIEDFYLTNPIARASAVMAECSRLASGQMLTAAE